MKKYLLFAVLLLMCSTSFTQSNRSNVLRMPSPMPTEQYIAMAKGSSLPILIKRHLSSPHEFNGSGVIISDTSLRKVLILTCEHVIAKKDSLQKTIGFYDSLFVKFNTIDSSSIVVPLVKEYSDELQDFALLSINFSGFPTSVIKNIKVAVISYNHFKPTADIQEGETILYSGYPMALGVDRLIYPVSRLGMVSQMVPQYPYILIDGFVQGGYSGSPVYLCRYRNKTWTFHFIGIIRAFQNEAAPIVQKNRGQITDVLAVINSGFSYVVKIDKICEVLEQRFNFRK